MVRLQTDRIGVNAWEKSFMEKLQAGRRQAVLEAAPEVRQRRIPAAAGLAQGHSRCSR